MKTYILTDNCIEEPLKIEAENYDEALNKVTEYYNDKVDLLEAAEMLYDMKIYELDELETLL